MSDEELKALFAEGAKKLNELAELTKRLADQHAKTEAAQELTQQTLHQVTARQAEEHAKTEEALRQAAARWDAEHAKTEEALRQAGARRDADHAKTEETLRRVAKQLGGLGNKFGSFTEGLAFASMRRILKRRFGAEIVSVRATLIHDGRSQEFDAVAVRNGAQAGVYLIEVKSELNAQELDKTLKKLGEFFDFMPQFKGMKLYGVICAVDVRGALAERVMHEGLYLATAGDENFKLVKPPHGFKPRVFAAA